MKKLAKIMALVMMLSGLGSLQVSAEAVTETNVIDFNDKTVTGNYWGGKNFFDTTTSGAVLANNTAQDGNAYAKIDNENGTSFVMSGGAGFGYIFDRKVGTDGTTVNNPVTGEIKYSFDVYAINDDNTSNAVLQFNSYTGNWSNWIMEFKAKIGKVKIADHKTGNTIIEDFQANTWYRVDLLMNATETGATVDIYLNGNKKSTCNINVPITSLWLTADNQSVGTKSRMAVDNIRVESEKDFAYSKSINFNEKAVSSSLWASAAYSGATETGSVLLRNNDTGASYQKIDDEHQTSYTMAGGASFKYVFNRTFDESNASVENAIVGKFKYSFDMFNKYANTSANGRVMIQLNTLGYDTENVLAFINYGASKYCGITSGGTFTWDYKPYTSDTWHDVDILFDASETSTKATLYIDNQLVGTKTFAYGLKSVCFSTANQSVGSKNYTAIDNIEVTPIAEGSSVTATPVLSEISADVESAAIKFSETVSRESVNSEPQVAVSERNKDTGAVRTIDAYAEIDYSGTKLNVFFNEKLDDNCEYTITIPSALTGLFGKEISTESVTVTTKAGMDYFDDFEKYSAGEVMKRFNNRAFTEGNGFYGKGLKSTDALQRVRYVVPEAIVASATTTDYIVSFDMNIPDSTKYVQFLVGDNKSALQWRKDKGVLVDWTKVADFEDDKWHHYDVLFDYDKSVSGSRANIYLYKDGVLATNKAYAFEGSTLSYVEFLSEKGYSYHIDNFHVRFRNEVEATTTLNGVISPNTKEATIKFDDAVKVSTLNTDNIKIYYNKFDELEYTIKSADTYSVTLEFADGAFEEGTQYTLNLDGVETCAEEPLAEDVFRFTAVEKFEVTDAKIMNGASEVASLSAWDKLTAYKVNITLDSTRTNTQTVYAVVAGYTSAGKLVNVGVAPVDVSVSGSYDANLQALDMTGADLVKVFAIDGFSNLAPLMAEAKVIE